MAQLSDLLALPDLGLRLIQAGAGDPEISWSSITELLDLSSYIDGGEIIMTTGLALASDDARWRDFVASLSRARVAAIGFGIGVNHDRVPQPLIAAASAYRVALFEIPLPVPFIAVSKAIAALIRADELRAARGALQAQQRLLDGARGGQDPAEVLASVAQATGRHLALVASDGAVLAGTAGFAAAHEAGGAERIALDQESALHLAVAGDAPLSPEGHAVITAGSMVLALSLRGDRAEETRERERWERLTAALLDGRGSSEAVAILAPSLELPRRVRAIAVQGRAEDVAAWRRRRRSGLDRLIAPAPERAAVPGLALAWQLCTDSEGALEQSLEVAAAHDLDAVVGRPAEIGEIPLSRRSAEARLRSLSTTAPLYAAPRVPQAVWADRDTPLIEALLSLGAADPAPPTAPSAGSGENARSDAARRVRPMLSARVLGPLSLHSEALGDPDRALLRDTLRAVFEADGQRGPAAAALGIHRNTLRDRVTRIERLTGRSLTDADDRAELWIALRLEGLEALSG
ncbi:PucR family transcriptional regulator [Leucobacter tenebrionis]|uniref:PucR family transcriptional regulator n=1 Tax=Leucobacter tenebrionis TaxID=2873270 RepID=UPI001CA652DB|nr:PucR family transcriptional regulator [Leucobacter tenebrionis]QZY51450.1 PucR family transcriptional regulator [Leucobacter tenebrionis]